MLNSSFGRSTKLAAGSRSTNVHRIDSSKLRESALKIAKFCQSAQRGRKARENVQLKRWEQANSAAYKIQVVSKHFSQFYLTIFTMSPKCAFRKWRLLEFSRIKISWTMKKPESASRSMQTILAGAGSFSEKIMIWRNVVELRRSFRDVSPEICLKALLNANGDVSRALALLGSKDFSFYAENKTSLSPELKAALNPSQLSNKALDEKLRAAQALNTSSNKIAHGARHGRSMRAHRHLQDSIKSAANLSEEPYPDSSVDLRQLVLKCYYSSNFVGSSVQPSK